MLPTRFTAGDTFAFSAELADYPANSGWVLKLRFVPRTAGTPLDVTCGASGSAHVATVTAGTTASWAAGAYSAVAWVELGAQKFTVETAELTIAPDPRTASTLDTRSAAAQALAAAEAAFAAWTPTTRSYRIGERAMEFAVAADILPVIAYWRRKVAAEQAAAARAAGRRDPRLSFGRIVRA